MKSFAVVALIANVSAIKIKEMEYPNVDIRGTMPRNAHPDSTFSSFIHNDWTYSQLDAQLDADQKEYPNVDIRGVMPRNAHPDSTFSSFIHNDWTY